MVKRIGIAPIMGSPITISPKEQGFLNIEPIETWVKVVNRLRYPLIRTLTHHNGMEHSHFCISRWGARGSIFSPVEPTILACLMLNFT